MRDDVRLMPTAYEQPKPIDGEFAAIVYQNHAEFEYEGNTVRAEISSGAMNVNGNKGTVSIKGDCVEISWEH